MKKSTWKKLDKKMFSFYSNLTKHIIKKLKFKYHKYQIFKIFHYVQLVLIFVYFATEIVDAALGTGSMIIGSTISGLFCIGWIGSYFLNEKLLQLYTPLFMMRKNPIMYKLHKTNCKARFNTQIESRCKEFNWTILFFIISVWYTALFLTGEGYSYLGLGVFFIYDCFLYTFDNYLHCIFDFDPPTKKKKKAKSKMTNLERKKWQDALKMPELKPFPT